MTDTEERILNSRYRIESLIGRGGMADVYLGHDLSLDRQVAVKMLRPDLARDPQFQGRFRREAQSSASLNHRNIVGVYDTGRADVEDSHHAQVKTPYIVMEYVDGVTLRHILHGTPRSEDTGDIDGGLDGEETVVSSPQKDSELRSAETPPPPPPPSRRERREQGGGAGRGGAEDDSDVLALGDTGQMEAEHGAATEVGEPLQKKIDQALGRPVSEQDAAHYMSGILGALQYSHAKGIVHRDIKPSNVMVSQDGEVKVMDFGIARALADSASTMTQTSAVVGTAQYLSPEQARGEVVDHRSDLYSAGCVLFELLTNRPPFRGESPVSVAYQHVREEPPQVSDLNPMVSPAMESVVHKALTKDPARRFQTAEEFDAALQNALHGIAVDAAEAPTRTITAVGAGAAAGRDFDDVVGAGAAGVGTPLSARTPEDPDVYEQFEEYEEPPRRRRGLAWIFWLLLLIVLLGGGAWALTQMLSTEEVEVPDVEGMERSDAMSELSEVNIEAEVEMVTHDEIEAEHAVGTDPEAGSTVEAGSQVALQISSGPDEVAVPDGLQGETEESVRQALEDVGLEVGEISEENNAEVPEGSLVSTDPEAGTSVAAGSEVDLVLSTGMLTFPGVFGSWHWEATETLEAQGLTVQIDWQETTSHEEGRVIGQSVDGQSVQAGDVVPQGSTVVLAVAYEPEEEADEDDEDEDTDDEDADEEDADEGGGGDDGDGSGDGDGGAQDEDTDEGDGGNGNGSNGDDDDGGDENSDDEDTDESDSGNGNDDE